MAGSITVKGHGKYKLAYMKDGERYFRTVNCNSYNQAEIYLAAFITEINEGNFVKPSKCTLEEFMFIYITEYGYQNLSIEALHKSVQSIRLWVFPKMSKYRLQDITANMWADFFTWLSMQISTRTKKPLATSYIERIFESLCSVYSYAIKLNYLKVNHIKECRSKEMAQKMKNRIKKEASVNERCLSYQEAFKLLDALEKEDLKYQLIVHFAIVGGLRRSEILGIKWANIDFNTNIVQIRQSSLQPPNCGFIVGDLKTRGSHRNIYMPNTTMALLKHYHEITPNTDDDFVFVNNRGARIGKRLSPSSVSRWFLNFRRKVGLPEEVPLHGLRHTSATVLISEGIDIKNVSGRLGHSNANTTLDIYSHALTDIDRLASDTLEKYLFEDIDDFKIPINQYSISIKRYTSKLKLSSLVHKIASR